MESLKKHQYHVNLRHTPRSISAYGGDPPRLFVAPSVPSLLKTICKKHNLKIEQIILTFQPVEP